MFDFLDDIDMPDTNNFEVECLHEEVPEMDFIEVQESMYNNQFSNDLDELNPIQATSIIRLDQMCDNSYANALDKLDSMQSKLDAENFNVDFAEENGNRNFNEDQYNPIFGASQSAGHSPHEDSDGFIHKGKTTLDTMGGRTDKFDFYVKNGSEYVKDHAGRIIKISGSGYKVNINGIDYIK